MNPIIVNTNNHKRSIKIATGEIINLTIDEYENSITALNASGDEIGSIEIKYDEDLDTHKIKWGYLDKLGEKYLRRGIGTAAIVFYSDFFGCEVIAENEDGITKDDGSHLTGDAPAFVQGLREQKIIKD